MNTLMKRERNIFRLVVRGRVSPYKTVEVLKDKVLTSPIDHNTNSVSDDSLFSHL